MDIPQSVVIVVLGGLFGWVLGKLPEPWVHMIAAVAIMAALVVFGRG